MVNQIQNQMSKNLSNSRESGGLNPEHVLVECKQNRKFIGNLKIIRQIRQIDFPKNYLFEICLNSMLS